VTPKRKPYDIEDSGYHSVSANKKSRLSQISSDTPLSSYSSRVNSQQSGTRRRIPLNSKIVQQYHYSINMCADTLCEICCRLLYADSTRKRTATTRVNEITARYGFETSRIFDCCMTCSKYLNAGKVPPYSLHTTWIQVQYQTSYSV